MVILPGKSMKMDHLLEEIGPSSIQVSHSSSTAIHLYVRQDLWGNTVNIDTGAVFGGQLTALRYPEMKSCIRPILHAFVS